MAINKKKKLDVWENRLEVVTNLWRVEVKNWFERLVFVNDMLAVGF